jgi:branched-subunit amino acid ABC-type transport system permease component
VFSQLLVNGLVLGSGFALIAIGHTIIFGLMKIANFAHGELYMLGAFFAFTFNNLLEYYDRYYADHNNKQSGWCYGNITNKDGI